jgi:hypothetical protein
MSFSFDYKQQSGLLQLIAEPNGGVISITPSLAKLVNYNPKNPASFHQLLINSSNYNRQLADELTNKMNSNYEVIDLIIKFNSSVSPILVTIMPILSTENTYLACCIFRRSRIPLPLNLINEPLDLGASHGSFMLEAKNRLRSLNELERGIVFLLGIGLKQREVGEFLGYTRGYIASIIAYQLCPAFGIKGGSSAMLIKIVRGLGLFDDHIPQLFANKLRPVLL